MLADLGVADRPLYLVSSNTHSLANLFSGLPRTHEDEVVRWIDRDGPPDLRDELERFREGRARGSWENFLYYAGRDALEPRATGVTHRSSGTALRVSAQVMPLERLQPELFDPRLSDVDPGSRSVARPRRVQHPARDHDRIRPPSAASTCWARQRR